MQWCFVGLLADAPTFPYPLDYRHKKTMSQTTDLNRMARALQVVARLSARRLVEDLSGLLLENNPIRQKELLSRGMREEALKLSETPC